MGPDELVQEIDNELKMLGDAIVSRSIDQIELHSSALSIMLNQWSREYADSHSATLARILPAANRCKALLRREKVNLQSLQNLYKLFSGDATYWVGI